MPRYQIFYLRNSQVDAYRQGPPKPKKVELPRKHYEHQGEIEADSAYAVWELLQGEEAQRRNIRPLGVGDALQAEAGGLLVCHYWGFDAAEWRSDKTKPPAEPGNAQRQASIASAGPEPQKHSQRSE